MTAIAIPPNVSINGLAMELILFDLNVKKKISSIFSLILVCSYFSILKDFTVLIPVKT